MRISNQMQNQMLSSSIQENQSAVYSQEQQIASGKRINRASDDPTAWAQAARLRQQQNELAGYSKNAEAVESHLESIDQALDSIGNILQGASELAVRGSDGTLGDSDRNILARQVDQLLEELVNLANSKYNGQYQFSGVQSQVEPFTVTRNAAGQIDAVSYVGGDFSTMVEIAPGDALPKQLIGGGTGENGILISNTGDAFTALVNIREQLLAGQNLAESGLQNDVNASLERVLVSRASVGAFLEHASLVSELHSSRDLALSENISGLEDIDVAEAVTELSAKQTAYEAALAMASKTLNMSLLNYL
jgi:flagellar hook-associated protein 3 FlgL